MKYFVNEECIGCGLCNGICPKVFAMTEEGTAKEMDGEIPAEEEQKAAEACESCPVGAIEEA